MSALLSFFLHSFNFQVSFRTQQYTILPLVGITILTPIEIWSSIMRFLIYGAGALGQALGCLLVNQGHTVSLITRQRFIDAIRTNGLSVTGIFGDYQSGNPSIKLYTELHEIGDSEFSEFAQ